jgi:nucleotide-binding universal stress UspA family protein
VDTRVDRVLVGVDGSAHARRALDWAMLLAGGSDAEVIAVHAVGLLVRAGQDAEPVAGHAHLDELRRELESDWCSPLAGSGLAYRILMIEGPAPEVLLAAAGREAADVIVVGSRGAGGLAELLLGSTSLTIVEQSDRPVLVVPAADHRRPTGPG